MASYNRVILLGNLTRDPEIRYTPSGTAVTDLGLAVNDRRKNSEGQWVEETTNVDVTLWGRTAEVAGEYLGKGSSILVEGRLKLDSWETGDGQKRSILRVVCERMQMVGPRPLIWHVMRYYAHFGHKEFILCLGYGASHIKNYFGGFMVRRDNMPSLEVARGLTRRLRVLASSPRA